MKHKKVPGAGMLRRWSILHQKLATHVHDLCMIRLYYISFKYRNIAAHTLSDLPVYSGLPGSDADDYGNPGSALLKDSLSYVLLR